jgi:DnaK suppressor protein
MAAKKSTPKAAASKADKQVSAKPAPKVAAKPEKKVAPAKKESEPAKAAKKSEAVVESPAPAAANGHANGSVSHSSSFVDKQKQRLLDLRDELVDAMTGTTRDQIRNAPEGSEASGSGMHQGDAGSDAYDRDFALSVLAKEQDALYEIEQALQRIKKGAYGVCEMSGKKIPQARLEAIPFARLTVECQAQWEKEYGNRRFRPSNEVGFSGGNYADDEDSDSVSLDEDED